ncbi:MAG: phosphotriesterase-related protein [Chloroflexota bacterium]|nr:phosphotriesterase-related protein [Chloroflexota bacterium]
MTEAAANGVLGSILPGQLGVTLMHEHLLFDFRANHEEPLEATRRALAAAPVQVGNLAQLYQDPFVSLDNCVQWDSRVAAEEVAEFKRAGGHTVVDLTSAQNGRDPLALQEIARDSGLNIIMGTGHYIARFHPPEMDSRTQDSLTSEIIREITSGVGDTGVRAGMIGEVGTSSPITPNEEKSVRAAAAAQATTGAPLNIHLVGWARDGLRVLDWIREEGGDVERTILSHMNPSHDDFGYQSAVAERGAYVEYDMLGMDYLYPPERQCPSDHECIRGIQRMVAAGYAERLLLSQDVFLKIMLTRHGGYGYAHVLRNIVPVLRKVGVTDVQIQTMLVGNPRRLLPFAPHTNATSIRDAGT